MFSLPQDIFGLILTDVLDAHAFAATCRAAPVITRQLFTISHNTTKLSIAAPATFLVLIVSRSSDVVIITPRSMLWTAAEYLLHNNGHCALSKYYAEFGVGVYDDTVFVYDLTNTKYLRCFGQRLRLFGKILHAGYCKPQMSINTLVMGDLYLTFFILFVFSAEYYMQPALIIGAIIVVLAIIGIIYVVMSSGSAAAPAGSAAAALAGSATAAPVAAPMSFSTCDDKQLSLSCPSGKINILGAKYGRFASTQCMHPNPASNGLCAGADVTAKLGAACNGQANCTTTAGMFGDPCPFIFKELAGTYTCQ